MGCQITLKDVNVQPWLGTPVAFTGVLIATATAGKQPAIDSPLRGLVGRVMNMAIYRAEDMFIAIVDYRTRWDNEYPSKKITVISGPRVESERADLRDWLLEIDGRSLSSLLPRPKSAGDTPTGDDSHVELLWANVLASILDQLYSVEGKAARNRGSPLVRNVPP